MTTWPNLANISSGHVPPATEGQTWVDGIRHSDEATDRDLTNGGPSAMALGSIGVLNTGTPTQVIAAPSAAYSGEYVVAQGNIATSQIGHYRAAGITVVNVTGAVAVGDNLTSSATVYVARTATAGEFIFARALTAASAGQVVARLYPMIPLSAAISVGLTAPAEYVVSGSPVINTGTLGLAWATAVANRVLASPTGASGPPALRALVTADLAASIITAAQLANDAVTTLKILDNQVTAAKLAPQAVTAPTVGAWPSCRAYRLTNQTIPFSTPTPILFDAETFDTDSMHSLVTNTSRLTIQTAGRYLFPYCIYYAQPAPPTAGGRRLAQIRRNGGAAIDTAENVGINAFQAFAGTADYVCAVGDYFELIAYHEAGSGVTIDSLGTYTKLSAYWMGP